jgi:hypothetical protein
VYSYTVKAYLHVVQEEDFCGRCCVPAAVPTVGLSVIPVIQKMSVVIRGDVFSNSGLAPKVADFARDMYFRSVHSC